MFERWKQTQKMRCVQNIDVSSPWLSWSCITMRVSLWTMSKLRYKHKLIHYYQHLYNWLMTYDFAASGPKNCELIFCGISKPRYRYISAGRCWKPICCHINRSISKTYPCNILHRCREAYADSNVLWCMRVIVAWRFKYFGIRPRVKFPTITDVS